MVSREEEHDFELFELNFEPVKELLVHRASDVAEQREDLCARWDVEVVEFLTGSGVGSFDLQMKVAQDLYMNRHRSSTRY